MKTLIEREFSITHNAIMDSFYHTLLSDSSHTYFPDNTLSNFRNYCSPSLSLDDDLYEVALVKCSFIYSEPFVKQGHLLCSIVSTKNKRSTAMNIPPEMNMTPEAIPWLNRNYNKGSPSKDPISASISSTIKSTYKGLVSPKTQFFASKNCYSIEELTNEMRTQLDNTTLEFDNDVLKLSTPKTIKFDEQIAAILGFSEFKMLKEEDKFIYTAQFKPFIKHGQTEMFIYSDLVKPQAMGDYSAPLLATIVYGGEDGQRKSVIFQHPQYFDVVRPNIDSIHIYIRSETGNTLPLTFGNFSAQLHFRRKRF